MADDVPTEYDLLIVTDATGSMGSFLIALNDSLPKIIAVSALTCSFARIGVLAYRDYCGGELIEWSGWYGKDGTTDRDTLIEFTKKLTPDNGGDWPEATKTALAKAYSVMRSDAKTLILLYTDAPPHMSWDEHEHPNRKKELEFLATDEYSKNSHLFVDWVSAARTLKDGDKKAQVFTIASGAAETLNPYIFMCYETSGAFFELNDIGANAISDLTMSILLAWLGVRKAGTNSTLGAKFKTYEDATKITDMTSELHPLSKAYLRTLYTSSTLSSCSINDDDLQRIIKGRDTPAQNLDKRYAADPSYRAEVVEHLSKIIDEDVSSIILNPVFGSLWRTVCNDRTSDARDLLIQKFGASVERIKQQDQEERMRLWLAESYNYETEIMSIIKHVAPEDHYPCVFLDPTEDWSAAKKEKKNEEEGETSTRAPENFTRDELLEIGRSCDYRILRRLGRALTRLTYVDSEADIPAHIKGASEKVPMIPLALTQPKYKGVFWQILLHFVCSGTKLAARPAALVAALSIRMGMQPLRAAAETQMLNWRERWNDLKIPETWNVNCLSLILDADRAFEGRREQGELADDVGSFLNSDDRQLFQRLVDYSLLTANMSTTLQARVGWRPAKTKVSIGPLVVCQVCKYPRSVTIMAEKGVCGICACDPKLSIRKLEQNFVRSNVTKGDTEKSEATWVECSDPICRAQYVVCNPDKLGVRPKCHYCRASGQARLEKSTTSTPAAPWIESCIDGRDTIVSVDITPKELADENGTAWLLRNANNKIPEPLEDRSLFKTVMASGTEGFASLVEILPASDSSYLKIRGKPVHNTADIKSSLWGWISARRTEAGTCSLCFNTFKKRDTTISLNGMG
ncbi:hypothetical protein NUW58_g9448 [Xylaria curta]|uniref:Uncharacterized protein n=1 Tax=Xylaria curta TaxID=42375 RepID=A0ACC1MWF1_9PEZI|nr:hypothetical protein NUW58_g9448 [Xylaria curta]